MVFIRHPNHAGLDGTVFDAGGGASATGAAIGSDSEYSRLLLARRLTVANRHGPMFLDDVEHLPLPDLLAVSITGSASTLP